MRAARLFTCAKIVKREVQHREHGVDGPAARPDRLEPRRSRIRVSNVGRAASGPGCGTEAARNQAAHDLAGRKPLPCLPILLPPRSPGDTTNLPAKFETDVTRAWVDPWRLFTM